MAQINAKTIPKSDWISLCVLFQSYMNRKQSQPEENKNAAGLAHHTAEELSDLNDHLQ